MQKRIAIRKKMGKPVFFTLTHCVNRMKGVANKYNYKANMHKLIFTNTKFYNVKYQASIMTDCNFANTSFYGVDFYNCNMKKVCFKNASFKNVVFYNCNLKNTEFQGATFSNVTFICTNVDVAHNLNIDDPEIKVFRTYKKLDLPEGVETELLKLANNDSIFNARVLHVNKNKLNYWTLRIIQEKYGMKSFMFLAHKLQKKVKWNNLYTVNSYLMLLEKSVGR